MPEPDSQLERGLGLSTTTYVTIASMVGVGILTTSGYVIKDTGSHAILLALWTVGGLLALCGALTVAELAAAMPEVGGEYVFIREGFGRLMAFLYGWISLLIGFSAPAAIVAHAAARYLCEPWLGADAALMDRVVLILAVVFISAFTAAHLRGQRVSSKVQDITTLLKLLVLVAVIIAGLALGRGDVERLVPPLPEGPLPWSAMGISLVYVMFSFTGWNASTYLAGEVRDPSRTLPRALLLGCGGVTVLYLLMNLVYIYALPVGDVVVMPYSRVEPVAFIAAERLLGRWVAGPLSIGIGAGLLASLSVFIFTGPRVYYAMARDGLFPAAAGRLDPKTAAPKTAILVQAAITLIILLSGRFKDILTYAGVGLSLSSFFVIMVLFVLRYRRPEIPRPFRVPLYPVTPLLFLICVVWMIVFAFRQEPIWSSISVGSILAGVPIYFIWQAVVRRRVDTPKRG